MADVFISYKKIDRIRIQPIIHAIEAAGYSVWWDNDVRSGERWLDRIIIEIRNANTLIGCWTFNAITDLGTFAPSEEDGRNYMELEHAEAGVEKVVGISFDRTAVPVHYRDIQAIDLSDWPRTAHSQDQFSRLLTILEARQREGRVVPTPIAQVRTRTIPRISKPLLALALLALVAIGLSTKWLFVDLPASNQEAQVAQTSRPNEAIDSPTEPVASPSAPVYEVEPASTSAVKPGFDCSAAMSAAELRICDNSALAEMDAIVNRAYKAARTQTKGGLREQVLLDQRAYLLQRDACVVKEHEIDDCMIQTMQTRLRALAQY